MDLLEAVFVSMVLLDLQMLVMASNPEGNSLFALKQSLVDKNGALSSWDYNLVNPCSWLFVICDNQLRVTEVSLGHQGLSGTLAREIGNLPYLSILKLQQNSISGSIPSELGDLQLLTSLDLSANNFSGELPSSLGNLSNARTILLNNNSFQGSIPSTFSNLLDLQILDLSYNDLNGSIPPHLANLNVVGNPNLCGTERGISCPGATPPPTSSSHGSSIRGIAAGVAASMLLLLLCPIIGFLTWKHRARHHKELFFDVAGEDDPQVAFGQLKKYSLRELQVATDNFDHKNVVGQGGFGKVFKGILIDGTVVAVKRLNASHNLAGGEQAFQTEVEIISLAVHRNLLRLQGFCVTPSERILVYPYMKNGCVASCLRNETGYKKQALTWTVRKRIALGAAQGLRYLHEHCNPKIIHRDVKAANVLLDEKFEAVVGDFGLAKLLDYKNTHITTNVRGTPGHIAPEYLSTGKSSEKTDVFGYGILLLELITGKRAFDLQRLFEEDVMLLDWVRRYQREKRLKELIDSSMGNDYNLLEAEEMIKVALLCTQASPADRPRMAEVIGMFEGTGLAERWEEWQKVEVVRRKELEQGPGTHRISMWMENSDSNLEAIELSAGR